MANLSRSGRRGHPSSIRDVQCAGEFGYMLVKDGATGAAGATQRSMNLIATPQSPGPDGVDAHASIEPQVGAPVDGDMDAAALDTAEDDGLLSHVVGSLEDDKAEELLVIDLRGKAAFADHMVIASGRSARHVAAMSDKLIDRLKALRGVRPNSEGADAGDWALIDAGDVVVHLFRPEVRDFYQLEKMWAPEWAAERAARRAREAESSAS